MPRAAFVLLFSSFFACLALAQRARFAPGKIDGEKPLLLGTAGAMLPETGALGPFGDLDGDGDIDLLAGNRVHLNDGFGSFHTSRPLSITTEARIAFFLANADANLDLLTRTHLYFGDGLGGFRDASAHLPANFEADAAVLADLDGDLDCDVLALERFVSPGPAMIRLVLNDGTGFFSDASASLPPAPTYANALVGGDLDGDLDVDLVIAQSALAGQVWRNDGAGGFSVVAGALPPVGGETVALAVVDVDGDADLDLVLGQVGMPDSRLLLNDGSGVFSASSLPGATWFRTTAAILVLDRETDGDQDLVLLDADQYESEIYRMPVESPDRLLVNDGGGTFSGESATMPAIRGASRSGFAGDLDGDGDPDLAIEDGAHPHRLYLNDGHALFSSTRAASLAPADPYDLRSRVVAIGDLNRDGLPDGFTPQAILINRPPGVFAPLATTLPELGNECDLDPFPIPFAADVALGDVDGDGDLDAYIAGRGLYGCGGWPYQSNRLWVNDGAGNFTDQTTPRLPVGGSEADGNPMQVELIELDGDGDLDAVCIRDRDWDAAGQSSCYRNDGTGVFSRIEFLGWVTETGALGDLDGDGDADYLEGNGDRRLSGFGPGNAVWRNGGSAHFVLASGAVPPHAFPSKAVASALGDIDHDGDLDAYIACGPGSAQASFVYVNDGTGTFADQTERLPESIAITHDVAFADVDQDGALDLLSSTRLFLNDGHGIFADAQDRMRPWGSCLHFAVGDLDLDGDPDLLVTDAVQTSVVVDFARHLEALGPARLEKRLTFVLHGSPRTAYTLLESLGTIRAPLGALGWLLVHPARIVFATSGYLDGRGEALHRWMIPASTALLGTRSYWQAFVGRPTHSTDLAVTTIGGL